MNKLKLKNQNETQNKREYKEIPKRIDKNKEKDKTKGKNKNKPYLIAFCLIISLPLIQITTNLLPKSNFDENREKKALPDLKNFESLDDYFKSFEDYYNDNFGFRSNLINLNSNIDLKLFNQSSSKDVILGKDDYLFYGEEMDDYNRSNILSDEDIDKIARSFKNFQDELKARNRDFVFFITPNKSTIYPEYLKTPPLNNLSDGNIDKLQKSLDKYGVNYIDMKKLMIDNKSNYELYFKRDTHWNQIASILATDELLKYLNNIYGTNYRINIKNTYEYQYPGDLDRLLGIKSKIPEETSEYEITGIGNKFPKTLAYADSFGNMMLPLIDNLFNQKLDMHNKQAPVSSNYNLFSENSNLVIFQMVERYIPDLANYNLDVFDNNNDDINKEYNQNKINLDKENTETPIKIIDSAYKKLGENNYYISTNNSNGALEVAVPNGFNLDYAYINLNKVKEYSYLTLYWADENEEFTEEKSIPFLLMPEKTKYKLDLKSLNVSGKKLLIKISDKDNQELFLNEILLYDKSNKIN